MKIKLKFNTNVWFSKKTVYGDNTGKHTFKQFSIYFSISHAVPGHTTWNAIEIQIPFLEIVIKYLKSKKERERIAASHRYEENCSAVHRIT